MTVKKQSKWNAAELSAASRRVTQMATEVTKMSTWPGITAQAMRAAQEQLNQAVAEREAMDRE